MFYEKKSAINLKDSPYRHVPSPLLLSRFSLLSLEFNNLIICSCRSLSLSHLNFVYHLQCIDSYISPNLILFFYYCYFSNILYLSLSSPPGTLIMHAFIFTAVSTDFSGSGHSFFIFFSRPLRLDNFS